MSKDKILERYRNQIAQKIPLTGSGAGTGLSAKCAELGGADMIIVYNSGWFRMAGRGSSSGRLSFSDANSIILDLAREVLPVVKETPVLAGVFASDPYRKMDRYLAEIQELGFDGVQNFPTVGNPFYDEMFYAQLTETGYGYDKEVKMISLANRMGLLTTPYCFNVEQTKQMVDAGADIVVAHMGLTTKGLIGAGVANSLDESVEKISMIASTAKQRNPNVIVICHGGSISEPADAQYIYDRVKEVSGFYGASSAERIPTENAVIARVKEFKAISLT